MSRAGFSALVALTQLFTVFSLFCYPFGYSISKNAFSKEKNKGKKGSINGENFSKNSEHLNESKAKWKFGGNLAFLALKHANDVPNKTKECNK